MTSRHAPPSEDALAKAAALARAADEARVAGRFPDAAAGYRAALALVPGDGAVSLELALCLSAQGKAREAAPLLARLLADGSTLPDAARERATRALADARRVVATVTIDAPKAGTAIEIDGAAAGRAPIPGALYLDAGTHTLRASLEGHLPVVATLSAEAGRAYIVELDPPPVPLSAAPQPPAPRTATGPGDGGTPGDAPREIRPNDSLVGAPGAFRAVALALASAGVLGGVALLAMAEANSATIRGHIRANGLDGTSACTVPTPDTEHACAAIARSVDARAGAVEATGALLGGAAILGAAAVISVFLLPPPRPGGGGTRLAVSPIASPSGGGLFLEGSW